VGKGKGTASGRGRREARLPALPDPSGDAPLHELTRDALSVFLYVALLPEETRALVKTLRLSVPGFRTEALGDVERCDVLSDEIQASPAARAEVLDLVRKAFGPLPLPASSLSPESADDLLDVGGSEQGIVLALWRVLADPDVAVRARAVPVLDRLAAQYYRPPPAGEAPAEGLGEPAPGPGDVGRLMGLEQELEKVRARAEDTRLKAEAQRDKLQAQLKEARAREAQAVDEAARAREAADEARRARERAEGMLAAAQSTDAAAEAARARAALRDAESRAAGLEARLAREEERRRSLEEDLVRARALPRRAESESAESQEQVRARAGAEERDAAESEEASSTWLMPIYTREFYDSLEGWDRRIQRAAFKQANLLAQDHRHPSLRALPLEGLPGYYRVRVATDVRLLYRRAERQNTVEILSLIDREDLDRYIKQAKTRREN
jgi:hypothetical protein